MNALSHSPNHAGMVAINDANGVGVQGRSGGNVLLSAGRTCGAG